MNGAAHPEGAEATALDVIPPLQLAFTIPTSPDTKVHLQITDSAKSLLLYIATSTVGAPSTGVSLGNLVYAMPNVSSAMPSFQDVTEIFEMTRSNETLSTALYSKTGSVDFVTRLAKVLARRTRKPVYVGGEVRFWSIEDEGVALRGIVEIVMGRLSQAG